MIKNANKSRKRSVEDNHDEDDSEFTPALSMNASTIYKEILNLASNTTSDKTKVAANPTDKRDQYW